MVDLNSLTVVELKQLLREQGLSVSGNKSELISRLEGSKEEFIVLDEDDILNIAKQNRKVKSTKGNYGKIETYCRSCRATLRYPSDYSGKVTCPRCQNEFKVNANSIGSMLAKSSVIVFVLTIVITFIYSVSVGGNSPESKLAAGIGGGTICISGLTLSVILFVSALIYSQAKKPLKLE